MRHLFRVEIIDQWGSNWLLGTKMCNFDPKIWIFGAKSHFFCFGTAIFVNRAYYQYTLGHNFPIGPCPNFFSEVGVNFWGSGQFLKSSACGR